MTYWPCQIKGQRSTVRVIEKIAVGMTVFAPSQLSLLSLLFARRKSLDHERLAGLKGGCCRVQAKRRGNIADAATSLHQANEFLAKLWRVSRAVLAHFERLQFEPKGRRKRGQPSSVASGNLSQAPTEKSRPIRCASCLTTDSAGLARP